jgi:hypothetical protein
MTSLTKLVMPSIYKYEYEGRLQSSWTHLITPSQNFVEVRWRSLFRSTSLAKRCTSYNAPHTSRKRAADRWSLRNFLPRSSLFTVGKTQKSHGARSGLYDGCSNGVPPIHFFKAGHRSVFEKWVERCKTCIACQGRHFEKETVTAPPKSSDSEW